MDDGEKRRKIIVHAYLLSQLMEFTNGEMRIFQKLNLFHDDSVNEIIKQEIRRTVPNYLAYLEKTINLRDLKKFFKKDLRIAFVCKREKNLLDEILLQSLQKEQEQIRVRVEELFSYCEPIFFNFESIDELATLLNKADQLGRKKKIPTAIIFIMHREELLRTTYPNIKILKKKLERLFSAFSEKKIFEKVISPLANDSKLNNPETLAAQEKMFQEINSLMPWFLKTRLQEILTITR